LTACSTSHRRAVPLDGSDGALGLKPSDTLHLQVGPRTEAFTIAGRLPGARARGTGGAILQQRRLDSTRWAGCIASTSVAAGVAPSVARERIAALLPAE
jgi:hypothetical protein